MLGRLKARLGSKSNKDGLVFAKRSQPCRNQSEKVIGTSLGFAQVLTRREENEE